MTALDILRSAVDALALIGAAPWCLLLATVVFLVVAEGLMFIPRVGFVLKLCIASLLAVQFLALLKVAAVGEPPALRILIDAWSLPPATMGVLFLSGLLPFAVGIGLLAARGPRERIRYFFGNILRDRPPAPRDFLVFKMAMHLVAIPFTFVAPGVVLKGYIGWHALEQGLLAALLHWQAPLALLLFGVAFEIFAMALPKLLPRRIGAAVVLASLLPFVLFTFAFTYTLSVRAFGI